MLFRSPNAEVVPSVDIGCVPLEVEFVNGIDSVSIVSYFWEFGDGLSSSTQFPSHSYEEEGNYEVKLTVVSEDGCVNVTSPPYQITVYPKPEAIMKITPQFTDIENAEVTCISLSIGSDSQLWSFGDGDSSVVQNIAHTYRDTGRYLITLVVENEFGCVDTSYEWVQIGPVYKLEVPNAFVPNLNGGNGGSYNKDNPSNQVFFPFTDYVRDYHLMIFNRWGELIFESFDLKIGWDGYYRGELCQQDLYVWKINLTYEDGKQESKVGEVHLIR